MENQRIVLVWNRGYHTFAQGALMNTVSILVSRDVDYGLVLMWILGSRDVDSGLVVMRI